MTVTASENSAGKLSVGRHCKREPEKRAVVRFNALSRPARAYQPHGQSSELQPIWKQKRGLAVEPLGASDVGRAVRDANNG